MHSRIFQISKEPIKEEDYIDMDDMPDSFYEKIADYVWSSSRESDIDWLKEKLTEVAEFSGDHFTIINKKKYFEDKYVRFINKAKELENISLEDFIEGKAGYIIYFLEAEEDDKWGFYVYQSPGNYYETLDLFMRCAQEGKIYYIGNTLDYHF